MQAAVSVATFVSTYINRDTGHKHDHRQAMEKLPPRIYAECRHPLIRGIHHLTRNASQAFRRLPHARHHVPPVPLRPTELPVPSSHTNGGEYAPVGEQGWPSPGSSAFEHPPSDPEPWVPPAEAPTRPDTDYTAAD